MEFELLVWHAPAPLTRAEAAAQALDGIPPHPGVDAFATELGKAHPGVEVAVEGSRRATVRMAPEQVDEVSADVYALARAHDLSCYDPGRDLVHNPGPLGAHEGMQLHTGDGMIVVDPDLALVHDALARLAPQNPFTALVVFGRHFIQVSPEPGGFELEFKDSIAGTLSRTSVPGLAEVQRAFQEYATDDRAFVDRHSWRA